MKTYYIDYLDKSGDLTHIWVNASNKAEAESEARSEYWDIDEIISIREAGNLETLQQLNKVELIGICGNIRIQEFSGKKVARITLATNYCYKSSQGEVIIETCWHSVSAWESSKVKDLESITKGTRLHIVGRLKNQRYTSADGTDHSSVEIIASSLEILKENLLMEE